MLIKRTRVFLLPLMLLLLAALACSFNPFEDQSASSEPAAAVEVAALPTLSPTAVPAQAPAEAQSAPIANREDLLTTLDLENMLIELYQLVNPSVVHILVYTSRQDFAPLGSG
ncbi:MAG: hypothetical protein JSW55_03095, partial [Chloroflexota bacterium]